MKTRRSWKNQDRLFKALGNEGPKTCEWKQDENGAWWTDCGNGFEFNNEGSPKDNKMKFCCYCGKPLIQKGHPHD
jgi:hypothetical protein